MFKIKTPLYAKFRNAEFVQCMNTVLDVYKKHESGVAALERPIAVFENAVNNMLRVLNENKAPTVFATLRPIDDERMKTARGLSWYLRAEIYRQKKDRVDHAQRLLASFRKHCRCFERFSLQHKTTAINKMLQDWQTEPALINAVIALNLENWVADLTVQNEVFYQTYFKKAASNNRDTRTKQLRFAIRQAFEELIVDTMAYARVSTDKEIFQTIMTSINNVIGLNNTTVAARRTRRKTVVVPKPTLPVTVSG